MHPDTPRIYRGLPDGDGLRSVVSSALTSDRLLTRLNRERLSRKRHEYLQGAYSGETAYVLTCGPSMDEVWDEELREFLADELVIGVKQTQSLDPTMVDFHLYNECRMESYDYPVETIRMSVSEFLPDHPSHVHYPIRSYEWDEALFVTDEYDRWRLSRSFERPWGIGIMFEIGLHLPVYLGCDRVLIMGFDMNDGGRYHFYDEEEGADAEAYDVDEEEFYYAQRTVPRFLEWTERIGVEVANYSPLTALDIPRVEDPYAWAREGEDQRSSQVR